ncbi:MAG: polyprenyl diphosphate synthase [bacterium]|nr:polyprenyl diphosphate synthase [bacterium]
MKTKKINHIAFIMDGNRRWAKKRGLPTLMGHSKGYDNLKTIADACFDRGIPIATFFAFSTENWNRSKKEVAYLLKLLGGGLTTEVTRLHDRGIQLKFIGDVDGFPADIAKRMKDAMELTKNNTKGILNTAVNYGGRPEILAAVRSMLKEKVTPAQVTEESFAAHLTTAGLPDPDLLIRTSGEQRLSGFLTWQSVYSELLFSKKMWPEFTVKDLDAAIFEFSDRERRFGK